MSEKRIEERNEAFDSAMREKLAGYEPTVPHALWNRISAELNETEEKIAPGIPLAKEAAVTPRWKMAIAAAVILTIGAGSLLFTFNVNNGISSTPTAHATAPATAPAVSIPVLDSKTVAAVTPAVNKSTTVTVANTTTPVKNEVAQEVKQENTTPENTPVTIQNSNDNQLASAPAESQNNYIETGTIPVSSLKRLSAPVSLNDEITVIKSAPSARKHHKHGAEESTTKVIVIGKKYDSAPDIRYQVPVRF